MIFFTEHPVYGVISGFYEDSSKIYKSLYTVALTKMILTCILSNKPHLAFVQFTDPWSGAYRVSSAIGILEKP